MMTEKCEPIIRKIFYEKERIWRSIEWRDGIGLKRRTTLLFLSPKEIS
jgi:hypothetical protein